MPQEYVYIARDGAEQRRVLCLLDSLKIRWKICKGCGHNVFVNPEIMLDNQTIEHSDYFPVSQC